VLNPYILRHAEFRKVRAALQQPLQPSPSFEDLEVAEPEHGRVGRAHSAVAMPIQTTFGNQACSCSASTTSENIHVEAARQACRRWMAGRDSFVGLTGAFGTFKLGRFHSPYDNINDIFGSAVTLNTGILNTAAIWAQGATPRDLGGFDERINNSVRYDTPNFAGFTGTIHYGSGENDRHSGCRAGKRS
jgi:hypothetical protein